MLTITISGQQGNGKGLMFYHLANVLRELGAEVIAIKDYAGKLSGIDAYGAADVDGFKGGKVILVLKDCPFVETDEYDGLLMEQGINPEELSFVGSKKCSDSPSVDSDLTSSECSATPSR